MDLVEHFRRQFAYDDWANREALGAVRVQVQSAEKSLKLLGHILSAGRLWMERIKQQPKSLSVWPEFTLDECESQAREMAGLWREYLDSAPDFSQKVSYKNSKGEPWSSTVDEILTHVIMHGAYHRGQIASHMRANGHLPAYTDFIHAVRKGLIE